MTQEEYYDMKKRAVALEAAIQVTCCLGRSGPWGEGDPLEPGSPATETLIERLRMLQATFLGML
jgi:hypothetical protein